MPFCGYQGTYGEGWFETDCVLPMSTLTMESNAIKKPINIKSANDQRKEGMFLCFLWSKCLWSGSDRKNNEALFHLVVNARMICVVHGAIKYYSHAVN